MAAFVVGLLSLVVGAVPLLGLLANVFLIPAALLTAAFGCGECSGAEASSPADDGRSSG